MATVLQERKECREMKVVMRRLLATEEAVDKVESMLQIGDGERSNRTRDTDEYVSNSIVLPLAQDKLKCMIFDSHRSVDSPAKRLERIAAEYNHMLYLVSRAGKLPFIDSLDKVSQIVSSYESQYTDSSLCSTALQRISRITSALQLDLSQLLTSILSAPPSSSESYQAYLDELTSALQTFSSLGLIHQAEEIIRKTVVKPFLLKAINRNSLSSSNESSSSIPDSPIDHSVPPAYRLSPLEQPVSFKESDSGPLLQLYNLLLRFISQDCGTILSIAERSLSSPRGDSHSVLAIANRRKREDPAREPEEDEEDREVEGFQILTNVIVDEIASRLVGELGTVIFAAGRPSVFHQVGFLPLLPVLVRLSI